MVTLVSRALLQLCCKCGRRCRCSYRVGRERSLPNSLRLPQMRRVVDATRTLANVYACKVLSYYFKFSNSKVASSLTKKSGICFFGFSNFLSRMSNVFTRMFGQVKACKLHCDCEVLQEVALPTRSMAKSYTPIYFHRSLSFPVTWLISSTGAGNLSKQDVVSQPRASALPGPIPRTVRSPPLPLVRCLCGRLAQMKGGNGRRANSL